jgi:hypothetical protein
MSEIEERLLAELARAKGVSITALKMSLATPPEVMAGIREDARRSLAPSSPIAPAGERERPRGNGWAEPQALAPPPGQRLIDAMMDQQDAIDRRELARRLAP